jgi:hypothetical protein
MALRTSKKGATFDTAYELARDLPGLTASTSYGTRALKVDKKFLARLKEDGDTLVLRVDIVSRDYMLRDQPDVFFITDHYRDYPTILVRLSKVSMDQLRELLEDGWRLVASPRRIAEFDRARRGRK